MLKTAIILDDYKLPVFEKGLKKAGYLDYEVDVFSSQRKESIIRVEFHPLNLKKMKTLMRKLEISAKLLKNQN